MNLSNKVAIKDIVDTYKIPAGSKLIVKQVKSVIGKRQSQRQTVIGLGLKGIGSSVTLESNDSFVGMIRAVFHLVEVHLEPAS